MTLRAEKNKDRRGAVLHRLLSCTAPYRFSLAWAVLFMLASSGLNVLPPWLFKGVVDDVLISRDLMSLNLICFAVVGIFAGKAVTTYWQQVLMNRVGQSVVMDLRVLLYDHIIWFFFQLVKQTVQL